MFVNINISGKTRQGIKVTEWKMMKKMRKHGKGKEENDE